MSNFDNYSGAVLVKAIEQLETLPRPLAGPLHNTLTQLRTALRKRNESDLRALTPEEIRLAIDALKDSKTVSEATVKAERWLGRRND